MRRGGSKNRMQMYQRTCSILFKNGKTIVTNGKNEKHTLHRPVTPLVPVFSNDIYQLR